MKSYQRCVPKICLKSYSPTTTSYDHPKIRVTLEYPKFTSSYRFARISQSDSVLSMQIAAAINII